MPIGCGTIQWEPLDASLRIERQLDDELESWSYFGSCFRNLGFNRTGCIRDESIVAVHPADREDPTLKGFYGTEGFRRSLHEVQYIAIQHLYLLSQVT
jgi:hypothetical protein